MSHFANKLSVWAGILSISVTPLAAQATRTWVSGVGDDANPCSRTAPCKTFAGAISKTAAGGEISVLDPGGFGGVTITKSITIDGGGALAGVLASGTNGIVVAAGATDTVTLRNLDIDGLFTVGDLRGIEFSSGKQLTVENCNIYAFGKRNISIESSTDQAQVLISNTILHDGLNNGIVVIPPTGIRNTVVLNNVRSVGNAAWGLWAAGSSTVAISNSVISGNPAGGIHSDTAMVELDSTLISGNGAGIAASNATQVTLSNTTVASNATAFSTVSGGTFYSFGNNQVRGNTGGDTFSAVLVARQ
jgi:hypothetical protein